jgi:hypothetical protein
MSTGIVFIADFIRSWAAYGFSQHNRDGIAKQCGLICTVDESRMENSAHSTAERIIGDDHDDDDNNPAIDDDIEIQRSEKFEGDGPPDPPPLAAPRPSPTTPTPRHDTPLPNSAARRLEPFTADSGDQKQLSSWWRDLEPLARSPEQSAANETPPPEPLLRRAWQRAIITEIGATFRAEGEPDVPALVESIAQQKLPKQIPRQRVKSNRLGLCCYLDIGDGMGPFAADQKEFVRDLQRVVGKDLLSLRRFRGTPLYPGRKDNITDELPAPGRPVLILSDLGIGRPRYSSDAAPVSEWLKFAEMLREAGCSAVALVPYPRARWSFELQKAITILFWDPTTNSRLVAAALRPMRVNLR